jgi:transposase, IS5 family
MTQLSLANGFERSIKRTRKQVFLEEMLAVVPWDALVARIAPFAPPGITGHPPYPVLLRVHFLQQWFSLVDEAALEALHDIPVYRAFAGIDLGATRIPEATTILRFRHLLERNDLATAFLRTVNEVLEAHGLMVRPGTQVDAKIARAPNSTKNRTGMRPPSGTRPGRGTRGSSG